MPPHVPRKRGVDNSKESERPSKRQASSTKGHDVVFHAVDALDSPKSRISNKETQAILDSIGQSEESSSESSSEEEEFEDVQIAGKAQESEEEMDWEDAMASHPHNDADGPFEQAQELGDLELTISKPDVISIYDRSKTGKKGPTKIERAIRLNTHRGHILMLMWHNTIRNSWINNTTVQQILVNDLTDGLKREIERWRTASGFREAKEKQTQETKGSRKTNAKGKGKEKTQNQRDWGSDAEPQEPGVPNMSAGDPIIRLLKHLAAYWKKRFHINSPGLRKQGYRPIIDLNKELKEFRDDPSDVHRFGEQVKNVKDFQQAAKSYSGSRDLSAQLFTALIRGIGIEARLVSSLQPAGFGWSQAEESKKKKNTESDQTQAQVAIPTASSAQTTTTKTSNAQSKTVAESSSELSDTQSIGSDSDLSVIEISPTKTPSQRIDNDLPFPIYWTEVLSPLSNTYYPVSTSITPNVAATTENLHLFEPRGAAAEKAKQVICYVVAYSSDGTAKDVTVRYLKRHQLPGKTKGFRLPPERVPIYNRKGKVIKHVEVDWFQRVLSIYARPSRKRTLADDLEDQGVLVAVKPTKEAKEEGGMPNSLQAFKQSDEYVLERHLRREEAILPSAKAVTQFATGKGDKAKKEPVYLRKDVVSCKTVESWHKDGRQIRKGEQPLKRVPIRAVTLLRKLEVEHAARETGEKPLQGLYSKAQTEWIIPPPIEDGKIPKNAYGNIDIYVPSMIPQGAVHIPLGGTVKVCKKLGIDYAEACTGFEFGHQMAVPVIIGVVVAEENEHLVLDAWEEEEERKRLREDEKREKRVLGLWRKFALGLRILQRVQAEYGTADGDVPDEINPFTKRKNKSVAPKRGHSSHEPHSHLADDEGIEDTGGGFLPEGTDLLETSSTTLHVQHDADNAENDYYEIMGPQSNDQSTRREKVMPTSLREAHQDISDIAESAEVTEADSDSDDYTADEEYPGFSPEKKTKTQRTITTARRSSRKAAMESPHHHKKK